MSRPPKNHLLIYAVSLILAVTGIFTTRAILSSFKSIDKGYHAKAMNLTQTFASSIREDIYGLQIQRLRNAANSIRTDKEVLKVIIFDAQGDLLYPDPKADTPTIGKVDDPLIKQMLAEKQSRILQTSDYNVSGALLFLPNRELLGGIVVYLSRDTEKSIKKLALINNLAHGVIVAILAIIPTIILFRNNERHTRKLRSLNADLEEAVKAKEIFLANMSHEIRTPMNSVIGYTELLKETELNQQQQEWLSIVQHNGDVLIHLINQTLRFSKIGSEKYNIDLRAFNLRELLKLEIKTFQIQCSQKQIDLNLNIDSDFPVGLHSDPDAILQCLSNLISNAIKFTNEGSVSVSANYTKDSVSSTQGMLQLSVKDTGRGIPENEQNEVFEAFSQIKTEDSYFFDGTGLGLNITRSLVQLLGGSIHLDSEVNVGSTFTLRIPTKVCTVEELAAEEKNRKKTHSIDGSIDLIESELRIIVAEDNSFNQTLIKRILESDGLQVEMVDDGRALIEQISYSSFDVILMDVNMPNLNGIEATKMIRSGEAGTFNRDIIIIAITASANEEFEDKCLNAGMNYFLPKPIRKADLRNALKHARHSLSEK